MDDSKKRTITEETLKRTVEKMNPVLIKSLPASPEEILPYAQRRTDPVISSNLSSELAERMRQSRLSDEDYLATLFLSMYDAFYDKASSMSPTASVLIAQTGADKTNLRKILLQQNPNSIIINSDSYKKFRPDADELQKKDPTHFGALTGIDSYDHAKNIVDFATSHSYDILIEVAPSLQQGMIGVNMEKLRQCQYSTRFHVMAVGDLISALAVHLRYENELSVSKATGDAKLTDLKRHNESYMAVEKVLTGLDPATISIYRRGTDLESRRPMPIYNPALSPIQILRGARMASNQLYINDGFEKDYNLILEAMRRRNAPQAQFDQLANIYKMYENYVEQNVSIEL